jgi:predicted RNase H-like nuclease (RuvC/YqgF family)
MYNRIFKTLENRFKEYESLEKYLDSHIEELQTENDSLKEIINILKAELEYAQSQLNQGMND